VTERTNDPGLSAKAFRAENANDWCAGCGDFGILRAIERALARLALSPDQVAVFGGIGCSGKTPYYLKTFGIHTLHGRVLPFATGAKLADPGLTVIAVGGDGDGLSIGAGHFVNSGRRNVDLTYILFDNGVYGLTKGQASPTLRYGEQTKAMAGPSTLAALNAVALALAAGYTWIGRGYAYDVAQLTDLTEQAIKHPGLALLVVLQPCPTYNQLHDKDWYAGKDLASATSRLYSLQAEGYDPVIDFGADEAFIEQKMAGCLRKSQEWGERIPTGVFWRNLAQPRLLEDIVARQPSYATSPPARRPIADERGQPLANLGKCFAELSVGDD